MNDVMGIVYTSKDNLNLRELTTNRAVAALPVAGRYRIIDFTLSNLVNSGVRNVGVIVQKNYHSLMDHLGSGKEWDLHTRNNGLFILPSFDSNDELAALETIFRKKLGKLSGYKRRGINRLGLIMVLDGMPLTATAENWADVVRVLQSGADDKYDRVFFAYSSALSYYNCVTDTTTNYAIDRDDFDALKKYARYMTENK